MMKWFKMIALMRKYLAETKAAIALEFSLSLIFYFTLILILLDLMLIITQWADVQRAQAMFVDRIKNRDTLIINTLQISDKMISIKKLYRSNLIFKDKSETMAINIRAADKNTSWHVPGTGDPEYCYSFGTDFVCNGQSTAVNLDANTSSVLIRTRFKPYRITVIAAINNTIFGDTIYATNLVTLTGS